MFSLRLVQLLLLALSLCAVYVFYHILGPSGQSSLVNAAVASGAIPVRKSYTSFKRVDSIITVYVNFFWPVVNGSDSLLTLRCWHFVGQIASIWMVVMFEASRRVNRGRFVTYTAVFGLLVQSITYAFTTPIWLAIWLAYPSPLASSKNAILPSSRAAIAAIPLAVALGCGIPTLLSTLSAPNIVTQDTKLALIAAWQIFPVYVAVAQQLIQRMQPQPANQEKTQAETDSKIIDSLRRTYMIALLTAITTHTSTLANSLGVIRFPTPFAPSVDFRPQDVFLPSIPPSLLNGTEYATLSRAVDAFLAWDQAIGSTAFLVWALWSLGRVWTPRGALDWAKTIGFAVSVLSVGGIAGLVIGLTWWRDEVVLSSSAVEGELEAKKEK